MGNSESKESFQTTIEKLSTTDLSVSEEGFWHDLISQPTSSPEISTGLSYQTLVNSLSNHPENIYILLQVASNLILQVSEGKLHYNRQLILNSYRFVARILAFLLEFPEQRQVLWDRDIVIPLTNALIRSMFVCGFTLEFTVREEPSEFSIKRLWLAGLFGESSLLPLEEIQEHRIECMRCLLAAFTETLYVSFAECKTFSNPWVLVASCYVKDFRKELSYSLLETVLTYDSQGFIPYSGYFYEDDEEYIITAVHLLLLLLDNPLGNVHSSLQGKDYVNYLQESIEDIDSPAKFNYIIENLDRLISRLVLNKTSLIPSSVKSIDFFYELLLVIWQLIDKNPSFEAYFVESEQVATLIDLLMITMVESIEEARLLGGFQVCSFILLHMSAYREFAIRFSRRIENSMIGEGEYYFDSVISLFHNMVVSKPHLTPLRGLYSTIICNLSAYAKRVGRLGSLKLLSLIDHLAKTAETDLLSSCIQFLNNRFQYHWDGSVELVYALLSKPELLETLHSLSLEDTELLEILYSQLLPALEVEVDRASKDADVVAFLEKTTMVGLFPVPHALTLKRYVRNVDTETWFRSFLWGLIFTRNQRYGLVHIQAVALFKVSVS